MRNWAWLWIPFLACTKNMAVAPPTYRSPTYDPENPDANPGPLSNAAFNRPNSRTGLVDDLVGGTLKASQALKQKFFKKNNFPKVDPSACGSVHANRPCDCRTNSKWLYCNEDTGWCGASAEHRQGSSGIYDCPTPTPGADEDDAGGSHPELLPTNDEFTHQIKKADHIHQTAVAHQGEGIEGDAHQGEGLEGDVTMLPEDLNFGRCGARYLGRKCDCIDYAQYCSAQTGWCGQSEEHQRTSTGDFDCHGKMKSKLQALQELPENKGISVAHLKAKLAEEEQHKERERLIRHEYWWDDCDDDLGGNRTDVLFQQLVLLHQALTAANIEYVISDGTLIGAKRSGRLNPHEVDNDITVSNNFDEDRLRQELDKRRLIMFTHDIPRVCFKRSTPRVGNNRDAPWDCQFDGPCYVPYTDLYPTSLHPYVSWETKQSYGNDWRIELVPIGDAMVNAPDHDTALRMLDDQYENWRQPLTKQGFENNLRG